METWNKRLVYALNERGKTGAELARATGTKPPSVKEWMDGITKNIGAVPQGAYESDGRKFLTYQSSRIAAYGGMAASYSCQTTFELENGRVVSANFKGNDCRSR